MAKNYVLDNAKQIFLGWSGEAPDAIFGMGMQTFHTSGILPLHHLSQRKSELLTELAGVRAEEAAAIDQLGEWNQIVVFAAKSHPGFGMNHPVLPKMGYKRADDFNSGLTRGEAPVTGTTS